MMALLATITLNVSILHDGPLGNRFSIAFWPEIFFDYVANLGH